jgi:signal transduction histidine kinase
MIARLRVQGKMNLLILLPLSALLFVTVPFVLIEVHSAQSATTTATAAGRARKLSDLVWQLQRERLLTAGFLATPTDDGGALRRQRSASDAAAGALADRLGTGISDELSSALTRVGSLKELRDEAAQRGTTVDSVARAYHAVIQALIDALRLVPQRTSDAEGTRQLTALDALLRANEESALRGMALIAAAVNPQTGQVLLVDATSRAEQFVERFVEQADIGQAGEVVGVEQGDAGRQVDAVAAALPGVHGPAAVTAYAARALAAVDVQSTLRRAAQDQVTGEIARAAAARAAGARTGAWTAGAGTALLFLVVAVLTALLSRSIVRPLRRLTRGASAVAELAGAELARVRDAEQPDDEQPPRLPAIEVGSADEVGELARAFNQVQAAATQLVERQMVSRRNVSLMFTNVAQRTRNLVARQLAVVDELERGEQNAELLANYYRLDHLATRLRRTAENLLVLASAREEARIKRPTELATLLRAALTEIEDYQRVRFGTLCEVVLHPGPASDLVLVFAELLENATSFSPPESTVDVTALLRADGTHCEVSIADRGIGLSPQRMAEENQRLVERERLDIAPTNVLGLFVVGRLARRHGLRVTLSPTPGGGTTATVVVPSALFRTAPGPAPVAELPATRRPAITAAVLAIRPAEGDFDWFAAAEQPQRAVATVAVPAVAAAPVAAPAPRPAPGPAAELVRYPALGTSNGSAPTPGNGTALRAENVAMSAGGLVRRVPGASLAPGLGERRPARDKPRDAWRSRDPERERSTFDSYQAGWSHGGQQDPTREGHE